MRRIYLFRHARPDIPLGSKRCIGQTDIPLGTLGRLQACLSAQSLRGRTVSAVYCSYLLRSRQTAALFSPLPIVVEGLEEMSTGEWENLEFSEIRRRYPEAYEKRAFDRSFPIPGGESLADVKHRFNKALLSILESSSGDIAVIGHAACNQSLINSLLGLPLGSTSGKRQNYGECWTLRYDGSLQIESLKQSGAPALDRTLCLSLLDAGGVPETIIRHSIAVTEEALRLCSRLQAAGIALNREHIEAAALLHDAARQEKQHDRLGAQWFEYLGYPEIAEIIARHHDLGEPAVNEAAVVYLADKLVLEDRRVSLAERFEFSAQRCTTPQARAAYERRFTEAKKIADMVQKACADGGNEVFL